MQSLDNAKNKKSEEILCEDALGKMKLYDYFVGC
jgi:hypothetical protein